MKPFWLGCTGIAVTAIAIAAAIHSSRLSEKSSGLVVSRDARRENDGYHRTASREGITDQAFEKMPAGANRESALRQLAKRRTEADPPAAVRWAESLVKESEREVALNHIAIVWGKENPPMAIALAERHHLSQGIVDAISGQWGKTNPDAATRWAISLSSAEAQENALLQILSAHAETDPAAAARRVTEQLPPGRNQDEAVMTVLHCWLKSDEAPAVAWVESFPDGGLKTRAESEIRGFRSHRAALSGSELE